MSDPRPRNRLGRFPTEGVAHHGGRRHFAFRREGGPEVFLKRLSAVSRIVRHPNAEAEILAPLLLRAAGLPSPLATLRRDAAGTTLFVETPLLRTDSPPHSLIPTAAESRDLLARVDLAVLADLAMVDILMGNADRSLSNLLLDAREDRVTPIPIDHNAAFLIPGSDTTTLSLGGFVAGFMGAAVSPSDNHYRRWQLRRCGTVQHILRSTPVFERLDPALPSGRRALEQALAKVNAQLTVAVIEQMLDRTATTLGLRERSVRLKEIGKRPASPPSLTSPRHPSGVGPLATPYLHPTIQRSRRLVIVWTHER